MIDPNLLFSLSGPLAMLGWLVRFFAPMIPRVSDLLAGFVIAALFSVTYAALILAYW